MSINVTKSNNGGKSQEIEKSARKFSTRMFFLNSFFIFTLSVAMFVFCPLHQLRKLALKIAKYINLVSEVDEAKNREQFRFIPV